MTVVGWCRWNEKTTAPKGGERAGRSGAPRESQMMLGTIARSLVAAAAAAIVLAAAPSAGAADDRGAVQGVVSSASGQPVAGAFVKLKNAERRLTFMVISQAQGRYEAKDLPVGRYTVQGVG